MSSAEEYRRRAASCILMAADAKDPANRVALMDMAQSWLLLADLAEKNQADFTNETPRGRHRI